VVLDASATIGNGPEPTAVLETLTDDRGRFLFTGLKDGRYQILASATGYVALPRPILHTVTALGGRSLARPIRLAKMGEISGSVRDELGQPLTGVVVRALRPGESDPPQRPLYTRTDEDGQFRISDVSPGDYVIGVISTATTAPKGPVGSGNSHLGKIDVGAGFLEWPPDFSEMTGPVGLRVRGPTISIVPTCFYPSVQSPGEAVVVAIQSGEERPGVNLTCTRQLTVRVAGRVFDQEAPAAHLRLRLVRSAIDDSLSEVALDTARTTTDSMGGFVFAGVPPGEYVVFAGHDGTYPIGALQRSMAAETFLADSVSVGSEDVGGVRLNLRRGFTVRGRLSWSENGSKLDSLPVTRVTLQPARSGPQFRAQPRKSVIPSASGEFVIEGVVPGAYALRVETESGWHVARIVLDAKDRTFEPLRLETESNLSVSLTQSASAVTATVGSAVGGLDGDIAVLVFPANQSEWRNAWFDQRRVRIVTQKGRATLQFNGLPAGDYFFIAIPESEIPPNWRSPARLAVLAAGATLTRAQGQVGVTLTVVRGKT